MMPWFVIYDTVTGRTVSMGTVVADPLPAGLSVLTLADKPRDDQMWDEATRTFVARPAPIIRDRIAEFMARPAVSGLSPAVQTALQNALVAVFGDVRDV